MSRALESGEVFLIAVIPGWEGKKVCDTRRSLAFIIRPLLIANALPHNCVNLSHEEESLRPNHL